MSVFKLKNRMFYQGFSKVLDFFLKLQTVLANIVFHINFVKGKKDSYKAALNCIQIIINCDK